MEIVLIFNGLGNQMSQYAFFLSKKKYIKHCVTLFDDSSRENHNGYELGDIFGIECENGVKASLFQFLYRILVWSRLKGLGRLMKIIGLSIVYEAKNYDFNPYLLKSDSLFGIKYFFGGWHSEKNFLSVTDEVRKVFKFPQITDENCLRFVDLIKCSSESVSLHVRRGDYVDIMPDDYYQFGGVATLDYYKKAIDKMKSLVGDCTYFIFSNDLNWCRENFPHINAYYVDCNIGRNSWRDMYLMTLCKHHINANSTFSWWGAWLAENEGITISPQRFIRTVETKDIYPERWIKI